MSKQITIYSTCQGSIIAKYLKIFFPDYTIDYIANYSLIRDQSKIELDKFRQLLKKTSIFIYQEMPSKWNEYSTDLLIKNNILSYLPQNGCQKIIIPYVFADWLWSVSRSLLRDTTYNCDTISLNTDNQYKYCNANIIINLKKHYDLNYILELYDNKKINFQYNERMVKGLDILKLKEQTSDIKISDYIVNNYRKIKLFTTSNHPTKFIFDEMVKQILNKLNFEYNNFNKTTYNIEVDLPGEWCSSSYDIDFHKFEFLQPTNDNYIKQIITEIYNS